MACNAYTYEALSGVLHNTPKKFVAFSSLPLKENAALADMLGTSVIGILWNKKDEVLDSLGTRINPNIDVFDQHKGPLAFNPNELLAQLLERLHDDTKAERLKHCMTETSPISSGRHRLICTTGRYPPCMTCCCRPVSGRHRFRSVRTSSTP